MKQQFKEVKAVDNFYQASSFFPMPLTLIGTLNEDKTLTSFGSYSLIFPYYIAGKEHYAMILECRNTSNTARGLLRHGKCTINFLPYSKKNFAQHVDCGFPGDTPEEKMKDFRFHLSDSKSKELDPKGDYPKIIDEALQVFECSWWKELDNAQNDKVQEEYEPPYHYFNGITSKYGAHFILKIDHILVKEPYFDAIIKGATKKNFCPLPTNWGYRDSKFFWCSDFEKPDPVGIPNREVDITSVQYAINRLGVDDVSFDEEAMKMLVKIPRPFLKLVLTGCVDWAHQNNVKVIGKEEMAKINESRKKKKA